MLDRSDAQLIGYLLNALEDQEREQVETQLARQPEWRRKLRRLKRFFSLLEEARQDFTPPPDLVERTCRLVARYRLMERNRGAEIAQSPSARLDPGSELRPERARIGVVGFRWAPLADHWSGDRSSWSALDLVSAFFVALLLFAILLPALMETRFRYHVAACQENFHQFYGTLAESASLSPTQELADVSGQAISLVSSLRGSASHPPFRGCPGWFGGPRAKHRDEPGPIEGNESPRTLSPSLSGYAQAGFSLSPASPSRTDISLHPAAIVIWRDARIFDGCTVRCWSHFGRGENWLFADGHVQFMPQPAIQDWERRANQLVALTRAVDR